MPLNPNGVPLNSLGLTRKVPYGRRTRPVLETEFKEEEMPVLDCQENFKFGCDPELFVFKDGIPVTAEGLIPGTKDAPHPVEFGAVQVDGMAAEFNIDPATSFKEFNRNIEAVMKQLGDFLPKDQGYELRAIPSVSFDPDTFAAAPDKAKELGCMPDFNAWDGEMNPIPQDPNNPYLRTASGHVHIGWTEGATIDDAQHIMNCRDLVKQLDWFLGAWSCTIDKDPTRRKLYGRAGACRFKDYGVEYRVLSNFWITSRDRRLGVWNRLQLAIGGMAHGFMPDTAHRVYNKMLVENINEAKLNPDLVRNYPYPVKSLALALGNGRF